MTTPTSRRTPPVVGERVELARCTINGQVRLVCGQQVDGIVLVTDVPLAGGGRAYVAEPGLEQDGHSALNALIADSLDQVGRHHTIPALVPADRDLDHGP